MNEIQVINKTEILGHEIQVISGGFGEDKKVMLAKTIAEIHGVELRTLNVLINNNISRFNINEITDLKSNPSDGLQLEELGFTKMQISKSNNIFLLSERGYTKLVSMMDNSNEIKWQVMDKLIDEYFAMYEVINSDEQLKAMALLKALEGNSTQDRLEGLNTYTEIKVKEETAPLIATIEEQAPKVEYHDTVTQNEVEFDASEVAKTLNFKRIGRNNLIAELKKKKVLDSSKMMYQTYIDRG